MKPYYEEPNIKIYNGDCLEVMKELPDKSIDLVLTSPPYDDLRSYETFTFDFENIAKELFRIIRDGGFMVWIVGDQTINGSETGTSFKQALYFKEIGFNLHDTMIYQKNCLSFPETNRYYPQFEYMFLLGKAGFPQTTNLICDRKNNTAGNKVTSNYRQKDGSLTKAICYGNITKDFGIRFNIWKYDLGYGKSSTSRITFQHPASFPIKLAVDHIVSWSNPDDTILDPFIGSGTTARACKDLGRKCIGIEISQKYCDIAVKRLGQEVMF
jgi:DNA modification methylase